MVKKVIATIGLSRGYTAFYDPKTHIILDLARPIAPVYEGSDVSNLKRAIGNTIYLVSGSLSVQELPAQEPLDIKVEQPNNIDVVNRTAEIVIENVKHEDVTIEEVTANALEEDEKQEEVKDTSDNAKSKKKNKKK